MCRLVIRGVSQDIVVSLSGRAGGSVVTYDYLVVAKELWDHLEDTGQLRIYILPFFLLLRYVCLCFCYRLILVPVLPVGQRLFVHVHRVAPLFGLASKQFMLIYA